MKVELLGWHFLTNDRRTGNGENIEVVPGQTLTIDSEIALRQQGYHASVRPLDALNYAPGTCVQRVRLHGSILEGGDKVVASSRTCLWIADATNALLEFSCWCAEEAFTAFGSEPDTRSTQVLAVVRQYIKGEATQEEVRTVIDDNAPLHSVGATKTVVYIAQAALCAINKAIDQSHVARYAWDAAATRREAYKNDEVDIINRFNTNNALYDIQNEQLEKLFMALRLRA